tara:strand:+ start:59 stop:220 length:162 start_codon:yes stop_codon:yes gene_type:complete
MDLLDARQNIEKISVDMENMAYQISALQDEVAKLSAHLTEMKEREDDTRRMVS